MANEMYERVSVKLNHPLAISNGCRSTSDGFAVAYRHKLEVYKEMGEASLLKGSMVHHRDENKRNNHICNLIWFRTIGIHNSHHRRLRREMTEAQALALLSYEDYKVFDRELNREILALKKLWRERRAGNA